MSFKRSDFRFFHRLRVRWAEVDMQKIVFNAHYLMYFDTAITDYWRALAMPYEESMVRMEGDLYVVKATVEFHASAHADEQIDIALKCSRIGNSSLTFTGAIFRGDEHLITGELIYVCNKAVRAAPPEVTARLIRGEPVDPAQVYFRCVPTFETAAPSLAWINERLFVGTGVRRPDRVEITCFTVL